MDDIPSVDPLPTPVPVPVPAPNLFQRIKSKKWGIPALVAGVLVVVVLVCGTCGTMRRRQQQPRQRDRINLYASADGLASAAAHSGTLCACNTYDLQTDRYSETETDR